MLCTYVDGSDFPLNLPIRFREINKDARPTDAAKLMRFLLVPEAVRREVVFAGAENDVFALRIYQEVSVLGADGAVATNDLGGADIGEGRGELDSAAVAVAVVRLDLRLRGHDGQAGGREVDE